MNFKSVAGIFCFLLVSVVSTFAQSTAYANVYAHVIAPVGIENLPDLVTDEDQYLPDSQTVLFIEVSEAESPEATTEQWQSGILTTLKITGDPQTTIDISLSEQSPEDGYDSLNQPVDLTKGVSIPAHYIQNTPGIVRIGATVHYQDGLTDCPQPVIITLNCY